MKAQRVLHLETLVLASQHEVMILPWPWECCSVLGRLRLRHRCLSTLQLCMDGQRQCGDRAELPLAARD